MTPLIAAGLVAALVLPVPPLVPNLLEHARAPAVERLPIAPGGPEPRDPHARWPLDPRPEVVAGFAAPRAAWSAGHRGVDLLGSPGAPVRAALGGRVTFAGTVAGRGVVVVDHGGYRTTYEPVRAAVRRGDQVASGAVLGALQTGRSHCAPRSCLHWGLIRNGTYRDPLTLIRTSAGVRLLPWDLTRGGERAGRPGEAVRW